MKKLLATIVFAGFSSVAAAGPAIIITDFGCGMLDGNGNGFGTTDSKAVMAGNPDGNLNFKCYATGVPNPTGKAVKWNYENTGLSCGTVLAGSTTDWWEVVDSEGNATLTCKFRPNS